MAGPLTRRSLTVLLLGCLTIPLLALAQRSYQLDFRAFYVASESLAKHLDPYADNHLQGEALADTANDAGTSRWIYPPPALFFVAPLATVSYGPAKLAFASLSLAALVWMLVYLAGLFDIPPMWTAFAFVSLPVIACVQRGQIDLLILFLLVLTFRFRRRSWSGVPLALAISIKIFPAALLLWLLIERRFRQAATCAACLVVISLASVWRFGTASFVECLRNLTAIQPVNIYAQPIGLFRALHLSAIDGRWIGVSPGFIGSYNNPLVLLGRSGIFAGAALVLAAAILLRLKRVSAGTGFFTLVLVSQFMNTRLWTMGMVMYLPICLVAIGELAAPGKLAALGKLRSTLLAILLMLPLFTPSQLRVAGISPRFLFAVALVFYFILRLDRSRHATLPETTTEAASARITGSTLVATT